MMKIIGLTGGIGSGKSTVAKFFQEKGIPTYNSDNRAKCLMSHDAKLRQEIQEILGKESYNENGLNRKFVASKIFQSKKLLEKINALVHPVVFHDFNRWKSQQNTDYIIKEAAILFESGSYKDCDWIISVIADEEIRIKRVMRRSQMKRKEIVDRIQKQWEDSKRIKYSDFVIQNESDQEDLARQVEEIHNKLLAKTLD